MVFQQKILFSLNSIRKDDIPENTFASIIEYMDGLTFEKKDSANG